MLYTCFDIVLYFSIICRCHKSTCIVATMYFTPDHSEYRGKLLSSGRCLCGAAIRNKIDARHEDLGSAPSDGSLSPSPAIRVIGRDN